MLTARCIGRQTSDHERLDLLLVTLLRCLYLSPWPGLHFGSRWGGYLPEFLSYRALCSSETIADTSF